MIPVGIDNICFYTSRYYVDLKELAQVRSVDPNKFLIGLGQELMAIAPPNEDIVTMAASAAKELLKDTDLSSISLVILATESSVDQSKGAGIWVHDLVGLPKHCRVIELKQACYSATCGIQMALPYLQQHSNKKVLLLAADIARYGLNTPGEPTQGCGAVAMLLSAHPKLVALEPEYGLYTNHVMDFWRPNYRDEAIVDGKYSTKVYLSALAESWDQYTLKSGRTFADHSHFCYHTPFTKMAEKAHDRLIKITGAHIDSDMFKKQIKYTVTYGRKIGNSYTAALYIGLTSLLENNLEDLSNRRLGFFSFGSGCVAEYFSGIVQPGYRDFLHHEYHKQVLTERILLTIPQYEELYTFSLPQNGALFSLPKYATGSFYLQSIDRHQRMYTHRE